MKIKTHKLCKSCDEIMYSYGELQGYTTEKGTGHSGFDPPNVLIIISINVT